ACRPTQPAAHPTPSPSPPPPAISSPSPSPSPPPPQRQEPALPAPVEETGAAAAGGSLYVMGGFNAAGASLDSVYVFDGSAWAAGPRLPLPVDHPSSATLDDRVYLAGGHSNGRDSARVFRLDSDHWTELAAMHFARGGHALVAAARPPAACERRGGDHVRERRRGDDGRPGRERDPDRRPARVLLARRSVDQQRGHDVAASRLRARGV